MTPYKIIEQEIQENACIIRFENMMCRITFMFITALVITLISLDYVSSY